MSGVDRVALQKLLQSTFGLALKPPLAAPCVYQQWRDVSSLAAAVIDALDARVVAVSGSQGSGKTTLTEVLAQTAASVSGPVCNVSLDDFYLPAAARTALSHAVHPLLRTRGVPGTHDWEWLMRVLEQVRGGGGTLQLPRFDKGRDDRAGTDTVEAKRLILEGWCLGTAAQPEHLLTPPCNTLEATEDAQGVWRRYVNQQLRQYYEPMWRQVDFWIHLRVPGFDEVRAWRAQQEQQLPPGQRMTPAEIERFIAHYERLTRWLWARPPWGPGLVIELDAQHRIAGFSCVTGPPGA